MLYCTCVVGDDWLPMLDAWLESVYRVGGVPLVVYADVSPENEKMYRGIIGRRGWHKAGGWYSHPADGRRTSSKVRLWASVFFDLRCSEMAFVDCDALVVRPVDKFFARQFDVAYTYKTDADENLRWPINGGVILCRGTAAAATFWREYDRRVLDYLRDDAAADAAIKACGAIDQAAMQETIATRRDIAFRGFTCADLNECRCVKPGKAHIIHYKGSWHGVLRTGRYNESRPDNKCRELYELWRDHHDAFQERKHAAKC